MSLRYRIQLTSRRARRTWTTGLVAALALWLGQVVAFGGGPSASSRSGESHVASDTLAVVATIPDLADLVARIGGKRVTVQSIATASQNLHAVRIRPSHLVALSRADAFVQVGLSLEHAWVPGLIEAARNSQIAPGGVGFIHAGEGFSAIEIPAVLDRSVSVDVHPDGNPHINLSFAGGAHCADRILAGLVRLGPEHEKELRANHAAWRQEYERALARWQAIAALVRERAPEVCIVHQEFSYLLRDLGIRYVASLEPRPGLVPTPAHLAEVIALMREREVKVLLTAPWSNNKNVAKVAKTTGAEVVVLEVMSGGRTDTGTWIQLIDVSVDQLARAVGVDPATVVVPEAGAPESSTEGSAAPKTDKSYRSAPNERGL